MVGITPWSLARRADRGRRALLLFVLAALLYGFGLHAARACFPGAAASTHHAAASGVSPCHGTIDVDVAEAACEAHCRTDVQSGRIGLGFDLPAAAPPDLSASLVSAAPLGPLLLAEAPPPGDTGPPLHILLHRLLR